LLLLWGLSIATAQPVIHSSFSSDDGNPALDEDGTVNGTVIWRTGVVHVASYYSIAPTTQFPNPVLIIRTGAIVKIADRFAIVGGVPQWAPTFNGYISAGTDNATLQIDGATITDIRDDSAGGDTNGDGANSSPSVWGNLRFSGSSRDYLKNSTIKYCKMGHIGSMDISGNAFLKFQGMYSSSDQNGNTDPTVLNASPRIHDNSFQFFSVPGNLDLRGMTPVVENNVFQDSAGFSFAVWTRI